MPFLTSNPQRRPRTARQFTSKKQTTPSRPKLTGPIIMVQVTVAGGASSIARVVIDAILEKKKHRVTSLTSQEVDSVDENGIHWKHANYDNKPDLVNILRGTDVLLCFFSARDTATVARRQKNLIDAAVEAGVRRFAPAEYAGRNYNGMAMFEFKDDVREYLEALNKDKKVLEYSLFQTGILTNEFAYPHKTATYFEPLRMYVDFEARRAIQPGAGDHTITLTTVEDLAAVLAEAVEFEGVWPRVGGICGSRLTVNELIRLGESIRGPFVVETVDEEAVEAGRLTTSWYPLIEHAGVPEGRKEELSKLASLNFLKATINGSWNVSEEWNNLLPHIQFTDARRYLAQVWEDKP